jgi:histidinol-phosphatase (PHP family)
MDLFDLYRKRGLKLDLQLALHDTHVHSTFSIDGLSTIRQYAEWGCYKLDCDAIWVTDHLDFGADSQGFGPFHYEKIAEEIKQISGEFPRLRLFFGVEIDFQSRFLKIIEEFLSSHRLDFVIGAVHYIKGRRDRNFYLAHGERAYDAYLDECLAAVNSGLIDSLGHLNRPAGINPTVNFNELKKLQLVLDALIDEKVALELNTQPFDQAVLTRTIKSFKQVGGEMVTLGSDAHHVLGLMRHFNKAKHLLLQSKIDNLTVFVERRAKSVQITG